MHISVIGSADCSHEEYRVAYELGEEIALRKATLICGGLGGVMEAAAKGAKEKGGLTIGILPGIKKEDANRFIDIPIITGLGEGRNVIVALSADVVIAVGGALGTLSELSFAMKNKSPVIGIRTWKLDKSYCSEVNIVTVVSVKEAIDKAFSYFK